MSIDKAKDYYIGKDRNKRLNCAQAIIGAYMSKFTLDEKSIGIFASHGGGKAPGGECGALYAAKHILQANHREKIGECETIFLSHAGSTKCKEIRQLRKLTCIGCVEKIAEYIDKI